MAQGELKKSKPAASAKKLFSSIQNTNAIGLIRAKKANIYMLICRSNALGPKKGARVIAPKKASLIRQKKMTK
ncbi:hypothetical protein AJ78_03488, partial [Emergomyces pasteurianus Ep9510]